MKRLKILWQGICLVFITMVLFTGCNETKSEDNTVAISVETKTIAAETIEQYKTISSTVLAENEVAVMPKVSGTVLKVYHQVGDKVKAGDILFEIEASDLEVQVESAQAALSSSQASLVSAQANYEKETGSSMENQLSQLQADVDNLELQYQNLLDTYEKNEQLYEADVISKQTLDDSKLNVDTTKTQLEAAKEELRITEQKSQAETKKISQASVNQAKASVEQAQSSLKSAEQQLSYAKVVAEIDGMISSCQVTKGSTVTTQSTAMTLVDMDRVKISFQVSDDVINQIKVGAKAYISIQAASDEPFEGTVSLSLIHILPQISSIN